MEHENENTEEIFEDPNQQELGFKSNKAISITHNDFMRIWNAAEIKTLHDNNLLHDYDLGYLASEALSSKDFYQKNCVQPKEKE